MMPSTWSHPTITRGSTADDLAKIERNAPRRDRKSKKEKQQNEQFNHYSKSYEDEDEESIRLKSKGTTTLTPSLNMVSLPSIEPETPHESRKHLNNDDEFHPPAKRARRPSATLSRSAPSAPLMSRNLSITSISNNNNNNNNNGNGIRTSKRLASTMPTSNNKIKNYDDEELEMAVLLPQIEDEIEENEDEKDGSASGEELSSSAESEEEEGLDDHRPILSQSLGLRGPLTNNNYHSNNHQHTRSLSTSMDILAAAAASQLPVPTVNRRSSNFLSTNPIGIDARRQFNNLNDQEPSSFDSNHSIYSGRRSSYKDSFIRSQPNPISIPSLSKSNKSNSSSDSDADEEFLFTPPNVAAANYRPPALEAINAANEANNKQNSRKLSFLPTFNFFNYGRQ